MSCDGECQQYPGYHSVEKISEGRGEDGRTIHIMYHARCRSIFGLEDEAYQAWKQAQGEAP